MSDMVTDLDLIEESQADKEETANELFNAMRPAADWGLRVEPPAGLTWSYYGGVVPDTGASPVGPTRVPNGTLALDASETCYIEHDTDNGDVTFNTSGATGAPLALDYIVTTSASAITGWLDVRMPGGGTGTGGSTPTGTGFPHITGGVQDGAAVAIDLSSAHATGTLAAARMPALTGDVTSSAGAVATTLANTAVTPATYGDATHSPQIAIDAKGRITAASNVVIPGVGSSAFDLHTSRIILWSTDGASISNEYVYGTTVTVAGTGAGFSAAQTNVDYFHQLPWRKYNSGATAGSSAGLRTTLANFWRGNAAGLGGFKFSMVAGVYTPQANMRFFAGLTEATAAPANTEPSSLVDIIGLGADAGETTFSFMHNDVSGTATKVALGANFPVQTTETDAYRITIQCTPNQSGFDVEVIRLNTGHTYSATLTSDIPTDTGFLMWRAQINNGATAAAVTLALGRVCVTAAP